MSLSIWNTKNLRNFSTGQSERGGGLCTEVWEGKAREVRQSQELGATKAKERAASYMEPCWGGGDEGKETMTDRARQKSRHPEDDSSGSVVGCRPGWSGMRREDKKVQIAAAEVWLWREGEQQGNLVTTKVTRQIIFLVMGDYLSIVVYDRIKLAEKKKF